MSEAAKTRSARLDERPGLVDAPLVDEDLGGVRGFDRRADDVAAGVRGILRPAVERPRRASSRRGSTRARREAQHLRHRELVADLVVERRVRAAGRSCRRRPRARSPRCRGSGRRRRARACRRRSRRSPRAARSPRARARGASAQRACRSRRPASVTAIAARSRGRRRPAATAARRACCSAPDGFVRAPEDVRARTRAAVDARAGDGVRDQLARRSIGLEALVRPAARDADPAERLQSAGSRRAPAGGAGRGDRDPVRAHGVLEREVGLGRRGGRGRRDSAASPSRPRPRSAPPASASTGPAASSGSATMMAAAARCSSRRAWKVSCSYATSRKSSLRKRTDVLEQLEEARRRPRLREFERARRSARTARAGMPQPSTAARRTTVAPTRSARRCARR